MEDKAHQNDKYDSLIIKFLAKEAQPTEANELEKWIASSKVNEERFEELKATWTLTELIQSDSNKAWRNIENRTLKKNTFIPMAFKIAASVLLIFTLGYFLFSGNDQSLAPVQLLTKQSTNELLEVVLSDGSMITLNVNSKIEYPATFDSIRNISLVGEAFFDIAEDKTKPFIIEAEGIEVRVLGTSFTINSRSDKEQIVSVESGKVQVTNKISNEKIFLIKNESVIVKKNKKEAIKSNLKNKNFLGWKTKTLEFNQALINDVIHDLSHSYNKKIVLSNGVIGKCQLTAKFENKTLKEILELLSTTFRFSIRETESEIIIDGKTC